MKQGRKPNTQPATAYDVRRYITLVQVIASTTESDAILALCEGWGVEPVFDGETLYIGATFRALAKHVVEYHREQNT